MRIMFHVYLYTQKRIAANDGKAFVMQKGDIVKGDYYGDDALFIPDGQDYRNGFNVGGEEGESSGYQVWCRFQLSDEAIIEAFRKEAERKIDEADYNLREAKFMLTLLKAENEA